MKSLKGFGFGTNTIEATYKADLEKFYDYMDSHDGAAFEPRIHISRLNTCTLCRITYGAEYKHLEEPELIHLCHLTEKASRDLNSFGGVRGSMWVDNTPLWLAKLSQPRRVKTLQQSLKDYINFFRKKVLYSNTCSSCYLKKA